MKIVNDDHLKLAFFVGRVPPRARTATFVVKAGFRLVPDGVAELLPEDEQPEFSGDACNEDDAARGLRYPSDFAPFKPGADLLLAGHCHAPEGRLVRSADVVFQVGPVGKRLVVFGDRFWKKGSVGAVVSDPLPFQSMPLTWARAFGGPEDPRNPIGRGVSAVTLEDGTKLHLLPNVESRHSLVAFPHDRPLPAGFGPIDPGSSLRATKLGSYDARWLAQRWPWLPDDFDWTFFNAAPRDQQLQGQYLAGDERLRFDGMHPRWPSYESKLPGCGVRLFVRRRIGNVLSFEEVPLKVDTLFADLDSERVILVWRGVTAADSMKLREFEEIFLLTEPVSRPAAADLAGYEALYVKRVAELAKLEETEFEPIDPIVVVPPRLPDTAWADRLRAKVAALPPIVPDDPNHPLEQEWRRAMGGPRPVGKSAPAPVVHSLAEGEALIRAELDKLRAAQPGVAKVFADAAPDLAAMDEELRQDEMRLTPDAEQQTGGAEEEDAWSRERVQKHAAARGSFDGEDLSGLDLSGMDFSGLSFREAVLDTAQLAGCSFDRADLTDASVAKGTLSGASFRESVLENGDFSEVTGEGTDWRGATVTAAEFGNATLANADFTGCRGRQASFAGCDLSRARFDDCRLEQPDFTGALVEGASFRKANVPDAGFYEIAADGATFEGAEIPRGRFSDGQAAGCNFTGCNLDDGVLENCHLEDSNFREAHLSRAIFTGAHVLQALFLLASAVGAKFDDARATGARFVQTNLFRATFENADLTDAAFWDSNCYEVEFFQAVLKGTSFEQTNLKGTKLA